MLKLLRFSFIFLIAICILFTVKIATNNPFQKKHKEELNIFIWTDVFDIEMIQKFEKKKNIKINLHFYNSNEELLAKIAATGGKDYDILFPSGYACKVLMNKNYLKKIDKRKTPYTEKIYPFLLNKNYDPNNEYTIPFLWEGYGIAYNPKLYTPTDISIHDLYTANTSLVMTPDPIETICITASHLFKEKKYYTKKDIEKIQNALIQQKKYVEAYADFRAKDLIASENVALTLMKTSYIDSLKEANPNILFTLPNDIIFTSIENAVISKYSNKDDLIYEFFDFIFQPENMATSVEQFPMYPSMKEAFKYSYEHTQQYLDTVDEIEKREKDIRFFSYILENTTIDEIIVKTKA